MSSPTNDGHAGGVPPSERGPTVLELVRLNPRALFPPDGEVLFRDIALAAELEPGSSVLDAACGRGAVAVYFAEQFGAEVYGVDPDAQLIEEADRRVREMGLAESVHFEHSALEDLPFRDAIFDLAIGEVGIGALADPARAISEMARVTKPRGSVVLIALTWTGHVDEVRRERLVAHIGARPLLLVEWKQYLRDAGVVDLHVEDWSDIATAFRPEISVPRSIADMLTLREKLTILRRALDRWGWRGVRGAIMRDQEVRNLLAQQRILGISMIRGVRWERESDRPKESPST